MKVGMTSLTFKKYSVEETMEFAKNAAIDGIEWEVAENHVSSDENIEKIKKLSAECGIEIFSLGSYCYLDDEAHCTETVETAKKLGAPAIRIWAGRKSPDDVDDEYFAMIVKNTQDMADKAAKYGIVLSFEYHRHSLTETPESAVKLIKAIDRENVKCHWQATNAVSVEENLETLSAVLPYASGIFHAHNYTAENGYMLLEGAKEKLRTYYKDLKDTDYCLLVEFTKDGAPESFYSDIKTLKEILA